MKRQIDLNFELWPKQLEAFKSYAQEKVYGGAAGGGKSHYERVEAIALCLEIPGLQYYLFRRSYSDLQKSYVEGPTGFNALLAPLINEGAVESVAKEIRFPNGSKIFLCHCQHEKDVFSFGSFEFHVLNIAEAGEFTEFMMNFLRSRVRAPKEFLEKLPDKFLLPRECWLNPNEKEWSIPRVTYTCNPVGPGKAFLKRNFVDVGRPGQYWRAPAELGGMLRQYIPAKLKDNPSLDPVQYAAKLKGIGKAAIVEAMLDGNWNVTVGGFFPQIDRIIHIIRPFMIPQHWPRFMAYDHGACGDGDPFSIGWYVVVGDLRTATSAADSSVQFPLQRDSIICYRRWNGRGLPKTNAKEIADGIHAREQGEQILFRVAGGDIIEQRGHGESIFSIFQQNNIMFRRADMRRQNGWAQVDYRLSGENGYPLSFWFEEAAEDLETMSNLQHDLLNPADTAKGDDHDADRHRYACMTRPIAQEEEKADPIDYRSPMQQATPEMLIKKLTSKSKSSAYVTKR